MLFLSEFKYRGLKLSHTQYKNWILNKMSVRESLKVGCFLKTTFKNTTFKSVFKDSLPISCSLKCLEYRACFNISTRATVILSRLFFKFFHGNIEWSNLYNQGTEASAMWSSETWTNPLLSAAGRPDTWANTAAQWSVISYGNQHQPGRFCQRTKENASN